MTSYGQKTGTRITVIDAAGLVLADSEKEPRDMENHLFRPEIQASLRGEKQMSIRPSSTLKTDMMYMSIPVAVDGRVVGALRLSYFMKDFEALMATLRGDLLKIVGAVTLVALVLAFFLTRSVTGPLREVIDASSRVVGGRFRRRRFDPPERRVPGPGPELQRHDREAQGHVRRDPPSERGDRQHPGLHPRGPLRPRRGRPDRPVQRRLPPHRRERRARGPALLGGRPELGGFAEVVRKVRETGAEAAAEAAIGDRTYYCSAARLAAGDRIVVTLHDVTEFRALEKTKRDFAVNVSHELKTPLTAIKGFVETMEPRAEEENKPYLEIIRRNTDRLIAIVEDLLVLSQLEDRGRSSRRARSW